MSLSDYLSINYQLEGTSINIRKFVHSFILLLFAGILLICPAAAVEQTINFEELPLQTEILDNYATQGVTFSEWVFVEPDLTGEYAGDQIAWNHLNPDDHITTISFSPEVERVKLDFKGIYEGQMRAYDSQGNLVDMAELSNPNPMFPPSGWELEEHSLDVSVTDQPYISYVEVTGISRFGIPLNTIVYDNLVYEQVEHNIPEFPTLALPMLAILGLVLFFRR